MLFYDSRLADIRLYRRGRQNSRVLSFISRFKTSKKNDISYFGNIIAPPPPPHPLSLPSLSARAGGGGGGRTGGGGAAAEEGVLAQATQLSKGVEGVLDQAGRRSVSLSSPRRT